MAIKILSVVCAILGVMLCLWSLWAMEVHHQGYMADAFGRFYGSIGLLITLIFAVTGIVLSRIWIRRNRETKASSSVGLSLIVLVTCILLFLITLPWLVLRGDLS